MSYMERVEHKAACKWPCSKYSRQWHIDGQDLVLVLTEHTTRRKYIICF